MVVPMMLMAGLVFDGGQVLSARREALDVAQNAARAGAQAIDGAQIRQGNIAIDPGLVNTAAQDYTEDADLPPGRHHEEGRPPASAFSY